MYSNININRRKKEIASVCCGSILHNHRNRRRVICSSPCFPHKPLITRIPLYIAHICVHVFDFLIQCQSKKCKRECLYVCFQQQERKKMSYFSSFPTQIFSWIFHPFSQLCFTMFTYEGCRKNINLPLNNI